MNKKTVNSVGEIKLLRKANDPEKPGKKAESELSTREINMQKRRERILHATATIVCEEGVDAVRLAQVAEMADVTVPTIHNLFGKKRDVFDRLIRQVTNWMLDISEANAGAATFLEVELGVNRLFESFRKNEIEFRAGFFIGERFGYFGYNDEPYKRACKLTAQKYQRFVDKGDLLGNMSPERLGEFVNSQFRLLRSDWVRGEITTKQFQKNFLWAFYVVVIADANPDLRPELLKRIHLLEKD